LPIGCIGPIPFVPTAPFAAAGPTEPAATVAVPTAAWPFGAATDDAEVDPDAVGAGGSGFEHAVTRVRGTSSRQLAGALMGVPNA